MNDEIASQPENRPLSQLATEEAASIIMTRPTLEEWKRPIESFPALNKIGYVWHPGVKMVICLSCEAGVMPSNIRNHSYRTHDSGAYAKEPIRRLVDELAENCKFADGAGRLPDVGAFGKLPAMPLLAKSMAYQCSGCGELFKRMKSAKRHCHRVHKTTVGYAFPEVEAQTLTGTKNGVMFAIEPSTDDTALGQTQGERAALVEQMQLKLARSLVEDGSGDWSNKDMWEYLTNVPWHHVVETNEGAFTVEELKTMVTIPPIHTVVARGTLARNLAVLVEAALMDLEGPIKQADYRLRQWLGSETENIEHGKALAWPLRSTVVRYSRTLAGMVLFLCHLREQGNAYSVDFDAIHDLKAKVPVLINAVMEDNQGAEAKAALWSVLQDVLEFEGTLADSSQSQYVVFHFLALHHLRPDGGFPPPVDVTQALAHLQWCFRLVMFKKLQFVLAERAALPRDQRDGRSETSVLQDVLRPIRAGSATQMGTLLGAKGTLRFQAEKYPRPPLARWDDLEFTRIYCEGNEFDLEQFREMNARLITKGWAQLNDLMLGQDIARYMTWPATVHDREGESGNLYSFLIDERNNFNYIHSPFATWAMNEHFSQGVLNGELQCKGLAPYLSRCRELLNTIAAMMHTTAGGPPRAEEAIQTRILEGAENRRNLFYMRRKLAWILDYNKSKGHSSLARFLPEETSKLIISYLVLIRPLEAMLSALGEVDAASPGRKNMMGYLFVSDGARWTGEDYGAALQQAFTDEMGQDIGIREYRQIQAAFSAHHLSKWQPELVNTDDAALEQQGHSVATHDREYNRMADQSADFKSHAQMRFEWASMKWQELVFPQQTRVAKRPGLEGEIGPVLGVEAKSKGVPRNVTETMDIRGTIVVPIRALNVLRHLLDDSSATFRSEEQAIATAAMMEQSDEHASMYRKDILVVLPTGAGKTLTWMVAQRLHSRDKITIVIVPLVALMLDLKNRLVALGQRVHVAGGASGNLDLDKRCGFVLLGVEKAVASGTIKAIHANEHRINRIVFDEAHLSYTARGYREVMKLLAAVMKARPPIVLMTGTCAPPMEIPMLRNLGLRKTAIVRASTDRPSIMYCVSTMEPASEDAIPALVVGWFRKQLSSHLVGSKSQVIIYVPLKTMGTAIAEELGVAMFESKTPHEEKREAYEAFRDGRLQVMVATTSFGAGIDIGTVDVVIHAGSPRTMVDFAQESGRAGREGSTALSMVFRSHRNPKQVAPDERCGWDEMEAWLKTSGLCRRTGLSAYLDGRSTSCASLPSAKLCDVCRQNGATTLTIAEEIKNQIDARRPEASKSLSDLLSSQMTSRTSLLTKASERSTRSDPDSATKRQLFTAPASTNGMNKTQLQTQKSSSSWVAESSSQPTSIQSFIARSPRTATPVTPAKRSQGTLPDGGSGPERRKALLARMNLGGSISLDGSGVTSPSWGQTRPAAASYADKLVPLLGLFTMKTKLCFACLGLGEITKCGTGACDVERSILITEGGLDIMALVNELGNRIRTELSHKRFCAGCYLPQPSVGATNEFHPDGAGKNGMNKWKCSVHPIVVCKALTVGYYVWARRLQEAGVRSEGDPEWLQDVLRNAKRMPEVSLDSWARLLKTECGKDDYWFVRIFYNMVKEAVERDERI